MLRTALTAAALALAGGLGVLVVDAAEPATAESGLAVTAQQLRINQRIGQAAVRRANEADRRLDALEAKAAAPAPTAPQPQQPTTTVPIPGLADDVAPPIVLPASVTVAPGQTDTVTNACPSSFPLRLGGHRLPETAVGVVLESRPVHPGNGWQVTFRNDGTEPAAVEVHVVCARS